MVWVQSVRPECFVFRDQIIFFFCFSNSNTLLGLKAFLRYIDTLLLLLFPASLPSTVGCRSRASTAPVQILLTSQAVFTRTLSLSCRTVMHKTLHVKQSCQTFIRTNPCRSFNVKSLPHQVLAATFLAPPILYLEHVSFEIWFLLLLIAHIPYHIRLELTKYQQRGQLDSRARKPRSSRSLRRGTVRSRVLTVVSRPSSPRHPLRIFGYKYSLFSSLHLTN